LAVIVEAIFRKDIGACCEVVPLAVAAFLSFSLLLPHLEGEEPPEGFFLSCALSPVRGFPFFVATKIQLAILFRLLFVEAPLRKDIGACCEAFPLAVAAFLFLSLLFPIWKVKSLQSLSLALLSPMERGSSSMPGEGIGSPLLLFELSKGEPGGSSIRAIACYFAALPLIAF
jgi:hypothetical protein